MKFNRSNILLISLISIFLLLSIGAASAAADVKDMASDSAIDDVVSEVAIDDISEVEDIDNDIKDVESLSQGEETIVSDDPEPDVYSDGEGGDGGDDPVSDSIPTTIEAENKTLAFGDNITIDFSLKDNESNPINNVNKSNLKVFYKNDTDVEDFNKTVGFTVNGTTLTLNQMPVGNYLLKIKFLNSTIDDKNYTESYTINSLNITKTNTRINATDVKVNIGSDVIIPFKIYVESNKTLNADVSRIKVFIGGEEYNFTNTTGGTNVTNGIKILNFTKDVGNYSINITYLGNDNCNPSNITIQLHILNNNTMYFFENVSMDFITNNITLPISVNNTVIINYTDPETGENKTNVTVTTLNFTSGDIILKLVYYHNKTDKTTVTITNENFAFDGENGAYNVSHIIDVPLNDATLTIIYANGTLNETKKTIAFSVNNTIINNITSLNLNNHTRNATIPIGVNQTVKVITDLNNITNVKTLNLTNETIKLFLVYNNGTDNETVDFNFTGDNGTYNITFAIDQSISLENATLTIIYANNTLNETNSTITLKGIIDLRLDQINVTAVYQDGEFVFRLFDAITNETMKNTNVTASGLWFYTFGDSSSLSGSKIFTTDANGYLRIKNENMHPNLDITGYTNRFVALPVGSYNLTFKGNGNNVLETTYKITVNKVQAKIVASDATGEFGTVSQYTFRIVNSKTNQPIKFIGAVFRIYADNLDATRSGATNLTGYYTSPNLNLTAGKYNLQLKANDSNVICSAVTKTLTVNKRQATIAVNNRTVYYGVLNDIVATVKDKKTGKVMANTYVLLKLYTTAKKYVNYALATNKKGVLTFSPPTNLKVGKHKFIITVLDNNYQSANFTRYVTIKKAPGKFSLSNVKTYYRSGKKFKIKLINTKLKKGIYGAKVLVKVYVGKKAYIIYRGNTTKTGLIQFKINYKPGTYKVVVTNNGDTGYSAKKVTKKIRVTKHPIRIKAVKLKVERLQNFKVKVISKKTKKGLSAVKLQIRVYTGKKYKTYTRKSNKKGIANLKIKQKKGKHKVIVSVKYPKYYTSNKIKGTFRVTK